MAYVYCEMCGDVWESPKAADSHTYGDRKQRECEKGHREWRHPLNPDTMTPVNAANRKQLQEQLLELFSPYIGSHKWCSFWHDRIALFVILLTVVLAVAGSQGSLGILLYGIPGAFIVSLLLGHGITTHLPGIFHYSSISHRWDNVNLPKMMRDFDERFPKGSVNRKKALIVLHLWMRQDRLWDLYGMRYYEDNLPIMGFGSATKDEWSDLAYEAENEADS